MPLRCTLTGAAILFGMAAFAIPAQAKEPPKVGSTALRINGVALGLFSYDEPKRDYGPDLAEIARLGADHVSIVSTWYMRDVRANAVSAHPYGTLPDATLEKTLKQAKALGLRILLLPIIRLVNREPHEWRGRLQPGDWDAWWKSYEAFIQHHAKIAKRTGTDMLCIGSELLSTEPQVERWRALAKQIRKSYGGLLTYSANWDHYEPVRFWDAVDVVGLSAYYRLRKPNSDGSPMPQPTVDELVAAWMPIRDHILGWRHKRGLGKKPLVFMEVGYPSLDGAAEYPWDETRKAKIDLEEQRRLYAAFNKVWAKNFALTGAFFWNWYGPGGKDDPHHNPKGKPALEEIRAFFEQRK